MNDECEPDKPGPTCLASCGEASLWPWGLDMTYGITYLQGVCHHDYWVGWFDPPSCTAAEAA